MSIALDRSCCVVEFMMPSVVELSIWTGVGVCGCPISLSVISNGTAAVQLMKVDPHLDLEASNIKFLIIS